MSLVVRNLTKRFTARGTPAVADVSFAAPTGGITTLLGPSGSGKSTVLRMVAGLEQPDSGTVVFGDRDFTTVPAQRRGIGFVFQSYALFKHMNVRKNIAFGLRVRKMPADQMSARVDELLALVQLEGLGDRYPASSRAGSGSASRSRARWQSRRSFCCSTSRSARWTRRCAWSCASGCGASTTSAT